MISSISTIKRFFIFHILLPLIIGGLSVVHFLLLHWICSSNTLGFYTNNFLTFYPYILIKDILIIQYIGIGYTLQIFVSFGMSHPDNIIEVNTILTPIHIVPEWYFLHLYMVLKAIPNKTSGLWLFITCCMNLSLFLEVKNISVLSRITSTYNWIYGNLFITLYMFNTITLYFIGAQLPQKLFLRYGRAINIFNNLILWSNLL
jgi:ubiquinol-cytochrome c reductase cytochrome b subunit